MKTYLAKYWQQIKRIIFQTSKKLISGMIIGAGIILSITGILAFQGPTGGDTDPTTAGYTSSTSWVSTNITNMIATLTAIKSKTDTITTGSSYCDPNSGKYCNIKTTCDGTEASVVVDASRGTGYCIEKTERVAAHFEQAKMTCENLGKRLPEPFEWKYTCDNAGALGVLTMIDNWEWASNTTLPLYNGTTNGVGAARFGDGGCAYASWNWLGYSTPLENSSSFRCVR